MDGFFSNAGGLFPGAGMLPEVKGWLFPETDFRSVFSVPMPEDSLQLCGRFLPAASSTSRSKTVSTRNVIVRPETCSLACCYDARSTPNETELSRGERERARLWI